MAQKGENGTKIMISMLCNRADGFKAANLDCAKQRAQVSDDTIEKQRLFLEAILNKRKIEELKTNSSQHIIFEELRQKAKTSQQGKPTLGKRTYAELSATMSVSQLKTELEARATESRHRLQNMRRIYNNIEKTVKESRGLDQI